MRGRATVLLLWALGGCATHASRPELPAGEREFLTLLGGWKPPPTADACTAVRPDTGEALIAWPREHGWLASGVVARAPMTSRILLVMRDARTREPLIGGELGTGQHGGFVLLLRVPALDRALLFRRGSGDWELAAQAEIPASALGKGFASCPVPELREGGWLEHGVERIAVLREEGPNGHSGNIWLWSGNGAGTETLADEKDARQRGEPPPGSSLVGEPPGVDPWFARNPLADWPGPVWTFTGEVK